MNELSSKVYLLEDSPVDLIINKNLLKILGLPMEIEAFETAEAFLEYMSTTQLDIEKKHIALLDIQLPTMSGFECVENLRKNYPEKLERLCVFMLSSTIDRKDIERATQDADIIQILEKPLDTHLFLKLYQKR